MPLVAAQWPQYRGPRAGGVDESQALAVTWNVESGQNVRWQTALPGLAHASPIVWEDRVYVATAVKQSGEAELKVGLYGDVAPVQESESYQWRLLALDTANGKIVWNVLGCEGVPKVKRHPKGTHCNSTPATDGRRIVAIFGSEGLFCFDRDGKQVWKVDLGPMTAGWYSMPSAQFGFGSSPVIHEGKVIVLCDVLTNSFLAAFDLADGKELWRTARQDVPTWGSPTVVEAAGRKQIAVNGWHYTGGYDLTTGRNLWRLSGGGDIPVPTPVFAHGLIYLTSAHGGLAPLRAVRAEATGEVTPADPGQTNAAIAWAYARKGNYMQTPIVVGDRLFACNDHGVLTCFDARTGVVRYTEHLSASGQGFTASPVSDGRHLYFTSEMGVVFVVAVADKFSLAATNELRETCLSTPAIADGSLFFRTRGNLIAVAALDGSASAEYAERISVTRRALEQRAAAQAQARQGKRAEAEVLFRESLSGLRSVLPGDAPALAEGLAELAAQLLEEGKFTEAEVLARECLAIREKKLPGGWLTFDARALLGRSLLGGKRYGEAEPLLASGYQGLKERQGTIPEVDQRRVEEVFRDLVRLYQAAGQPERAAALREQRQSEVEEARFNGPNGLAVDGAGNLYVADSNNNAIRKVSPLGVVTTLAGLAQLDGNGNGIPGSADGTGSAARFNEPGGAAVDGAGNVYVADSANHTVRKVTSLGVVTTLAGLAGKSGSADGTGNAARFNYPNGVAVDGAGNVYVTDEGNTTIRKVTAAGTNWVVTTLAGLAGSSGSADGTGSAARFEDPGGMAVDSAGNVYVAETGKNTIRRVTPVGTNWVVTTLAGLAGSSGGADGTGSAARFVFPWGLAVEGAGNVYVADFGNCTVRKVTPAGVVTTLAGLAGSSGTVDGTGSAARFSDPSGVAVDSAGNVYLTDTGNHTVRRVTPAGVVTTLAGLAGKSGSADGTGSAAQRREAGGLRAAEGAATK